MLNLRKAAPIAVPLFRLLDTTKRNHRLAARFHRRHADAEIVVNVQLQVALELGAQFAITAIFAEHGGQPQQPGAR